MTTDEIYCPVHRELLHPEAQAGFADLHAKHAADQLMYDWQWHALDGTILVDYVARGETIGLHTEAGVDRRRQMRRDHRHVLGKEVARPPERAGTDAFAIWSFRP